MVMIQDYSFIKTCVHIYDCLTEVFLVMGHSNRLGLIIGNNMHCNAVITRVSGAIKSNRVISDTAL